MSYAENQVGSFPHWNKTSRSSFPGDLVYAVEQHYIIKFGFCNRQDDVKNSQGLELLQPFDV